VQVSDEGVVPGDRLVGILDADGGISVYPMHSDALVHLYESDVAWIDVRWDLQSGDETGHKVVISMLAVNKPGSLAQISSTIAASEANVHDLFMRSVSDDFHRLVFVLEVRDLAQLTDVLKMLQRTSGLSEVQRATVEDSEVVTRMSRENATLPPGHNQEKP
jgi:guanosine-3',5'-bis(diphosphate) 3'-pyrophosphohydrolase